MSPFDSFAEQYDDALQQGLSITGEDQDYFARGRITAMAVRLARLGAFPSERPLESRTVLDFGCGTGGAIRHIQEHFPGAQILGVDTSEKSLAAAHRAHPGADCRFQRPSDTPPQGSIDLAHCNGVFHHIDADRRADAAQWIYASLRSGGWFCLWENNPWNPGTRMVMKRIPFDRDAVPLSYLESRSLLKRVGFEVVAVDFCFYFPRPLAMLRPFERWLVKLPLGGQYCVYARKR